MHIFFLRELYPLFFVHVFVDTGKADVQKLSLVFGVI